MRQQIRRFETVAGLAPPPAAVRPATATALLGSAKHTLLVSARPTHPIRARPVHSLRQCLDSKPTRATRSWQQ